MATPTPEELTAIAKQTKKLEQALRKVGDSFDLAGQAIMDSVKKSGVSFVSEWQKRRAKRWGDEWKK